MAVTEGQETSLRLRRGASGLIVMLIWASWVAVGVALVARDIPACGWTDALWKSATEPTAFLGWSALLAASIGPLLAITWGNFRLSRGGRSRRWMVYLSAAGCAGASLIIPSLVLGFSAGEHAPNCDIGAMSQLHVAYLSVSLVLACGALVLLAVSWARAVRR